MGDADSKASVCIQRKLGGLGDILMTTPLLKAIKSQYPNCVLTYSTAPDLFRVLENNPYIDHLKDFRTVDPMAFDFFADVTSVCPPHERSGKPPINRIDLFAKRVGVDLKDPTPIYKPRVQEVEWANKWLTQTWGSRSNYKLVVVSVASEDRDWETNQFC